MKKTVLLGCVIVLCLLATGHEFWLHPNKFFYTIRETAWIRFRVGENFSGENWKGDSSKVNELVHYSPSGNIEYLSEGHSFKSGDSLRLPLPEEGTHMVTFRSNQSFISLEPEKFNQYLKEEGLDEALLFRKQQHEENKTGTEQYLRSVKTIFQVGTFLTDACTKATGLPLDIIPLQNPYELPQATTGTGPVKNRFRVLFKGQPLANALVRFWYAEKGKPVKMDSARTNTRGYVNADRKPGPFMASCVHMVPATIPAEAQWQSYWGSVSFEYPQFFNRQGIR